MALRQMTIGLMGSKINTDNLGCAALTYSLIQLLEKIGHEADIFMKYIVFENNPSEQMTNRLCHILMVEKDRLVTLPRGRFSMDSAIAVMKRLKHMGDEYIERKKIKECDVIIDLTEGDSFSDIYGKTRFYDYTQEKLLVESMGLPLILGPQTYGPYYDDKVVSMACDVIENAMLVISRDNESKDELVNLGVKKDIIVGTDLAFGLGYEKYNSVVKEKIRVGINPSGLLSLKGSEEGFDYNKLKLNYDEFIAELIDHIAESQKYEVHLISHVGNEAEDVCAKVSGVVMHEMFDNPISAKSFIAGLDVFIGSRMHATIAAFSTNVATIPLAYSKKFSGLYSNLGYNRVVDLTQQNKNVALRQVMEYLEIYKTLQNEVKRCNSISQMLYSNMYSAIKSCVMDVFDYKN